jgi:hypothetical protein
MQGDDDGVMVSFLKTRAGVSLLCGHYNTEKQFEKVESFSLLAA